MRLSTGLLTTALLAALVVGASASLPDLPSSSVHASVRPTIENNIGSLSPAALLDEEKPEVATTVARGGAEPESALLHRLKVGFYFALWYALNIIYNSK